MKRFTEDKNIFHSIPTLNVVSAFQYNIVNIAWVCRNIGLNTLCKKTPPIKTFGCTALG